MYGNLQPRVFDTKPWTEDVDGLRDTDSGNYFLKNSTRPSTCDNVMWDPSRIAVSCSLNTLPLKGLVSRSALIFSVGQCTSLKSCLSFSCLKKAHLTLTWRLLVWKLRGSVCIMVMHELLSSAIMTSCCGKPSSTRTSRAHRISEVTSLTPTISASVEERTTVLIRPPLSPTKESVLP